MVCRNIVRQAMKIGVLVVDRRTVTDSLDLDPDLLSHILRSIIADQLSQSPYQGFVLGKKQARQRSGIAGHGCPQLVMRTIRNSRLWRIAN